MKPLYVLFINMDIHRLKDIFIQYLVLYLPQLLELLQIVHLEI